MVSRCGVDGTLQPKDFRRSPQICKQLKSDRFADVFPREDKGKESILGKAFAQLCVCTSGVLVNAFWW